jgi:hypothetical protein
MGSSVAEVYAGPVQPSILNSEYDAIWKGVAVAHKSYTGANLAMWRDDDESYAGYADSSGEVSEGVVKSVPHTIPKSVTVEVGANLEAGLIVNYGWPGTWSDWSEVDNKVRTVVRMDAVYSVGLVTLSGGQDPAGNETGYYKPPDEVKTTWELIVEEIDSIFDKVGSGISDFLDENIGAILVIGVIVVGIVVLVIFIRIGKK